MGRPRKFPAASSSAQEIPAFSLSSSDHSLPASGLVRFARFVRHTGLNRTTVYRMIDAGKIPRPVKLGQSLYWKAETLHNWYACLPQSDTPVHLKINR